MSGGRATRPRSRGRLDCRDRAAGRTDEPALYAAERGDSSSARREQIEAIGRGGYVLSEASDGAPRAVIIATGSEVDARDRGTEELLDEGQSRCASCRCLRPACSTGRTLAYRDAVLPPGVPRVAVEAGVSDFWRKYVGLEGAVVGIDRFGESAPAGGCYSSFSALPRSTSPKR